MMHMDAQFLGQFTNDANTNNYIVLTNYPTLMAVWCDPLQNFPTMVADYGTNVGDIMMEPVVNGNFDILFDNTSTNSQTYTITGARLGLVSADYYSFSENWSNVVYTNIYGNSSMSITVTAGNTWWATIAKQNINGATFSNVDIPTNTLGTHGYSGYFTNGIFFSNGTY